MSEPKRHHFVPRWYLEGFTDAEGFLHIFDERSDSWRRQRPDKAMTIRHYYRQPWAPEGIDPNIFEKMLGQGIESVAKKGYRKILQRDTSITEEEGAAIVVYLELQRIRVPRQARMAEELLRATLLARTPPNVVEAIMNGEIDLTIDSGFRFEFMKLLTGKLQRYFARMNWMVYEAAAGESFVTSDSPVSFYHRDFMPPSEPGIALVGTMVVFPISARYLLTLVHPELLADATLPLSTVVAEPPYDDRMIEIQFGEPLDANRVREQNWIIAQLSDRVVVGQEKRILEECLERESR